MNSLRETGMDSENKTCRHRHGNTEVINHEQTCEQLRTSYLPGVRRRSRGMCFCSYRTHRSSPGAPHCLEPHSPGAANTEGSDQQRAPVTHYQDRTFISVEPVEENHFSPQNYPQYGCDVSDSPDRAASPRTRRTESSHPPPAHTLPNR